MKTCLIVDDSSVIRKVARRILEGLEFQITEAEDGEGAIEACRGQLPDAILLDWNMPKMDGYEFLRSCAVCPAATSRRWCSAPPKMTSRTLRGRCTPGPTNTS
jgi:CheY-like chemotaxis protein